MAMMIAVAEKSFHHWVADLRRESCVTSMRLHGLSEADSGELVKGLAGHGVPQPLVRALHRETEQIMRPAGLRSRPG